MSVEPVDDQPADDWTARFSAVDPNQAAVDALRSLPPCEHGEACTLFSPPVRAYEIALTVVQAVSMLSRCAEIMYQHGDQMAGEEVIKALGRLIDDQFYPYFVGAGLPVTGAE